MAGQADSWIFPFSYKQLGDIPQEKPIRLKNKGIEEQVKVICTILARKTMPQPIETEGFLLKVQRGI